MTGRAIRLDDVGMSPFLKKVTAFSSGGPFLERYVLAIVGVALLQMTPELEISSHWSGLIGVASLIGLTFGASVGGWVTDLVGRKKMFIIDLTVIVVLSTLCFFISTPLQLFILRFLIGVTIGADYPIATSMIAEFTPRRYRAMSMGIIAAVWYLGANVAYVVGYLFMDMEGGWRWMLASSIVPCLVILVGRWSIPESPRWLMSKGRVDEANAIIREVYGQDVVLDDEAVEKTKFSKLLQGTYMRRILFVGIIWLCQAMPMFAIYTYGPTIMAEMGLADGKSALIGEIVIGTFFLLGTIPAMILSETWGRRPLIICCFLGMSLALLVLGVLSTPSFFVIVTCFALYALFSGGPGNLQWLYPNELFPTEVRASAMGLAMAISRIGTVFSIYILPSFIIDHGSQMTMAIGAAISFLGLAVSIAWAPETKGYSLAETSAPEFRGIKRLGTGRSSR